jgi:hypothetical protein
MAESGGLPGWVEAWVGKVVQVHVHGDPDPLFGVLEDWDGGGGAAPHAGNGQPHRLSRGGCAFGADDDPRDLVVGALRLGTTGGARREGLALLVGFLRSSPPVECNPTLLPSSAQPLGCQPRGSETKVYARSCIRCSQNLPRRHSGEQRKSGAARLRSFGDSSLRPLVSGPG